MKKKYKLSPLAELDVAEIVTYVGERNRTAARDLHREFKRCFVLLAKTPLMGQLRDDLRPGLRCFSLPPYVVLYRPLESDEASVEIVRVVHGARNYKSLDL